MRIRQFFARKSLEMLMEEMAGENRLRRVLGPISLTSLGVGAIIGAGIFVMTGRAAAVDAGPAIIISYMVAALGCAFAAFCYAEFAAMAPVAGSAYTYAFAALGEIFAWIIGWDLILEYAMACACVAAGWSHYLDVFLQTVFGWKLPTVILTDPFSSGGASWFNLPAICIMAVVTAILIVGIRESAVTNAILVMVKLIVVLFVIVMGISFVKPSNWTSVPINDRLLPGETDIDNEIRDYVKNKEKLADDAARQRETLLTGWVRNAFKRAMAKQDIDRKVQNGKLTTGAAAEAIADAEANYADKVAPAGADLGVVGEITQTILDSAGKKANDKWGMLGLIGLNKWLAPIDDAARTPFTPYGLSGLMLGASIVFFAFIGFDSISTHSEEAKNPARDLPIGIIASLAICTVLYIGVSAVITGMERYPDIDRKAAVAKAFQNRALALQADGKDSRMMNASAALISTGALAGLTSVLLVTFLSQARVFLAMARDRLLPPSIFGVVHPKFKTPHISTFWTGLVICLVAGFTPIDKLEEMVNIGTLFAFVVVCATVMMLRLRRPEAHRPFRCPALFIVAPLGILVNLTMMLFLPLDTWLRLVVWLAIGLAIYFFYGHQNSVMHDHLMRELQKEGVGPTDAPFKN